MLDNLLMILFNLLFESFDLGKLEGGSQMERYEVPPSVQHRTNRILNCRVCLGRCRISFDDEAHTA